MQEILIDCFCVYAGVLTDISFHCLSRGCTEEQGHGRKREIGVVIHGKIKKGCLCFTYTPASTVEFCFSLIEQKAKFKSASEVSKFRVNSRSDVYHCAIRNLPTFRVQAICTCSAIYVKRETP